MQWSRPEVAVVGPGEVQEKVRSEGPEKVRSEGPRFSQLDGQGAGLQCGRHPKKASYPQLSP